MPGIKNFTEEQFVQMPSKRKDTWTKKEAIVYLEILACRNGATGLCCPSMDYLVKRTGYSKATINAAIKGLNKKHAIAISKHGNSNHYLFPDEMNTTKISYNFLNNPKYSADDKGFYALIQEELELNHEKELGALPLTKVQLADKLGISRPTLDACITPFLIHEDLVVMSAEESGINIGTANSYYVFKLTPLQQKIILEVNKNAEEIHKLKRQVNTLTHENEGFKQRLEWVERVQGIPFTEVDEEGIAKNAGVRIEC